LRSVKLPEGWHIKATDHSMWSNLVDDKGRNRASIFYKAAFYDREAFLSFNRRFSMSYIIADYDESLFEYKPEYIETGKFKTAWVDEDGREVKGFENMREEVMYIYDGSGNEYGWRKGREVKPTKKPILKKNPDYVKLTGYEKYSQPFHFEVHDHDGTILFSSDVVKTDFEYSNDRHSEFFDNKEKTEEKGRQQCKDWLEQNYPDWQNVLAYWD
jgi:hypothetical protein